MILLTRKYGWRKDYSDLDPSTARRSESLASVFTIHFLTSYQVYNTSWYQANDAEMDLFPFRALRDDISIKEAAYLIIKG